MKPLLSQRLASENYKMPFKAIKFTRSFFRAGVGWADVGKKQKDRKITNTFDIVEINRIRTQM